MQELERFRKIIEHALSLSSAAAPDDEIERLKVAIADTWAAMGSTLCLETLRRMMTFENELTKFFNADDWSAKSLLQLPAFLQKELAFIVDRIEFEREIEGKRLSKPKYVQQLAVQRLLQHYSAVLPAICDFYQNAIPNFVAALTHLKMSEAATQVTLASLHSYWKLPQWFDELSRLLGRYDEYRHYSEAPYKLPVIDTSEMSTKILSARDLAITRLGSVSMVEHIFEPKDDSDLPDHFGQIYFELAEECINALEQDNKEKLEKIFPMFLSLALLAADSKFPNPEFEVDDEFRLHLISTVINDLASVLGFAILYAAYFGNNDLAEGALSRFDAYVERAPDKQQYLKRMVLISNRHSFSYSASPRGMIRFNWKTSFEQRARRDGFGDQLGLTRGQSHPNRIVREFLKSHSDASHLFFAKQVLPQLDPQDFEIDHHITALARQLREGE